MRVEILIPNKYLTLHFTISISLTNNAFEFFYGWLNTKIEQTLIIVEYTGRIKYPRKSKTSLIYHLTITSKVEKKFSENVLKFLIKIEVNLQCYITIS